MGESMHLGNSNYLKIDSIACQNDSQFRFQSIAVFFEEKVLHQLAPTKVI